MGLKGNLGRYTSPRKARATAGLDAEIQDSSSTKLLFLSKRHRCFQKGTVSKSLNSINLKKLKVAQINHS